MSNDLISRKEALERLRLLKRLNTTEAIQIVISVAEQQINNCKTAFDKEKVIEEIRNVHHGYYNVETENEIIEIIEKGGIE